MRCTAYCALQVPLHPGDYTLVELTGSSSPPHCHAFWPMDQMCCCMQRLTLDMPLHLGLQGRCTVACTRASRGSFASRSLLHCFHARFQSETLATGDGAKEVKLHSRLAASFTQGNLVSFVNACHEILSIHRPVSNVFLQPACQFTEVHTDLPGGWSACLCTQDFLHTMKYLSLETPKSRCAIICLKTSQSFSKYQGKPLYMLGSISWSSGEPAESVFWNNIDSLRMKFALLQKGSTIFSFLETEKSSPRPLLSLLSFSAEKPRAE